MYNNIYIYIYIYIRKRSLNFIFVCILNFKTEKPKFYFCIYFYCFFLLFFKTLLFLFPFIYCLNRKSITHLTFYCI